jgi:hypothetical protein
LELDAVLATLLRLGRTLLVVDFSNPGKEGRDYFRRQVDRTNVGAEFHQESGSRLIGFLPRRRIIGNWLSVDKRQA